MAPIHLQRNASDSPADPAEDLRGRSLSEVLPPDLFAQLHRLRDDGGIHNIHRYRVHDQGGDERVLNITVAPLLSKNCDWIGRLIIFDDVTERVRLESQLAQAEKLSSIGLLAAGVAHEVNTPLTVISTQAQILVKQLSPDDKNQKAMEKIVTQTFRASEIVNSLLNFSRTKAAPFAQVDINKLISESLLLLEHQLRSARIQVESELDSALSAVFGNSDKLQQVFLNLFLNAKDAMPDGGRLRVVTWVENSHVAIEVSDTGVGIPPEHVDRIYDPFFTTKGSGRGTGLGLAVSYGIIHEHSGKIEVQSMPGFGTRFRLSLPTMRKAVHA
jgi:signal transduction histidine kinase